MKEAIADTEDAYLEKNNHAKPGSMILSLIVIVALLIVGLVVYRVFP